VNGISRTRSSWDYLNTKNIPNVYSWIDSILYGYIRFNTPLPYSVPSPCDGPGPNSGPSQEPKLHSCRRPPDSLLKRQRFSIQLFRINFFDMYNFLSTFYPRKYNSPHRQVFLAIPLPAGDGDALGRGPCVRGGRGRHRDASRPPPQRPHAPGVWPGDRETTRSARPYTLFPSSGAQRLPFNGGVGLDGESPSRFWERRTRDHARLHRKHRTEIVRKGPGSGFIPIQRRRPHPPPLRDPSAGRRWAPPSRIGSQIRAAASAPLSSLTPRLLPLDARVSWGPRVRIPSGRPCGICTSG